MQRKARKSIRSALNLIGLYDKQNDSRRLAAAKDLGNKRAVDALPKLRELAASDENEKVRRMASESIAIMIVDGLDPDLVDSAERLKAVKQLAELNSIRALDLLNGLRDAEWLTRTSDGLAIVDQAVGDIERHASITAWIGHIFKGLSSGSILLLISLGLAVTFGLMGVINMAHGEMLMLGAITSWACFEYIGGHLPAEWSNWWYVLAIPAAFLVSFTAGVIIEVSVVRHLYKRPLDSMLATIGVSYILIQAVRTWKGG